MKRTLKQNSSLHLWFTKLAQRFEDLNLERKQVIELTTDVPWTEGSIKEILFRPIMFSETGKMSSTQLTTKELLAVENIIHKALAERLGITQPFPSIEPPLLTDQDNLINTYG